MPEVDGIGRLPYRRIDLMRLALVAALLAALAGPAAAQPHERLAVGNLDVTGEPGIPAERLARLRANLVGGFAATGWIVIPEDEVRQKVASNPALVSCQSDVCFKALGEAVDARWVLAGSVSVGVSTSYSADVRLVDVATGTTAAKYSNTCGVCTATEANNWLGLIAADLRRQVEAAPGAPAAAATTVTAAAPPPEVSRTTLWAFRGGAIGAAALGIGGFIVGGVETARSRSCTVMPGAQSCIGRRDTTNGQVFGYVTGSVLLVGAAVLGYYGWWHYRGHTVALVPGVSPTGAAAALKLSF